MNCVPELNAIKEILYFPLLTANVIKCSTPFVFPLDSIILETNIIVQNEDPGAINVIQQLYWGEPRSNEAEMRMEARKPVLMEDQRQ